MPRILLTNQPIPHFIRRLCARPQPSVAARFIASAAASEEGTAEEQHRASYAEAMRYVCRPFGRPNDKSIDVALAALFPPLHTHSPPMHI